MKSCTRGKWKYDAKENTITNLTHDYEIDLRDCETCAGMLDWICQFAAKPWISDKDLGVFVRMLDEIFYPQANMCSFGKDKTNP